jgi:carboxymethylenebutenolidase
MTQTPVPYFLARPTGSPPWPGVVVIQEGNGISPQLLRVCERLAGEGYLAAAPDIFHRFGGPNPERAQEQYTKIKSEDALEDIAATVDVLRANGAERVGVTGFCMGGRFTYETATSGIDVQAAVGFYGGGIAQRLGTPTCPMLLLFGGTDEYIPTADIEAVQAHHGDQVVVYPQAGHGFFRDGSDSYDADAAGDAWERLTKFFGEHLRP